VDIDAIMDLAITAARDTFGRTVTYTPPGGGAAFTIAADFQRTASSEQTGQSVDYSTYSPVLDCRMADFDDEGVDPRQGALVTLTAEGIAQTYEVTDVQPTAVGTVVLVLGRRST